MKRSTGRLIWIGTSILAISTLTRIGLAIFCDEQFSSSEWLRFMGVGLVFDIAVVPWFLLPWCLYEIAAINLRQRRLKRIENIWAGFWGACFFAAFLVVAASEFAFWNEFASRFDFIAVDYLIYTHEVIGNIRESYPLTLWLSIVAAVAGAFTWFTWPKSSELPSLRARIATLVIVAVAAGVGFVGIDTSIADTRASTFIRQLSLTVSMPSDMHIAITNSTSNDIIRSSTLIR